MEMLKQIFNTKVRRPSLAKSVTQLTIRRDPKEKLSHVGLVSHLVTPLISFPNRQVVCIPYSNKSVTRLTIVAS